MRNELYHPGGFIPTAPAHNVAQAWDSATATYTRWDEQGNALETRPLTPDEIVALTPAPPPPNPAADALDAAAAAAANSLVADVRDLAVLLQSAADALRSQ